MLEVVEVAGLATVQDVLGRPTSRRFGVPVGGAADAFSATLANRLLGNPDDAAVLEVAGGLLVRTLAPVAVSVTGGLAAVVDGVPMAPDSARLVAAGGRVRLSPGSGLRGYVAIPGGIGVEPVLGSRSTDLRTGFGGLDGRPLQAGDRLTAGAAATMRLARWAGSRATGPIRLVPGPHATPGALELLAATSWRVGSAADRTGVRLDGGRIGPFEEREIASIGLLLGAVQVPPDGIPIVMLADGPVTGGYPVVTCVIGADIGRVAQARPGDRVTLEVVTREAAVAAWTRTRNELAAIEPLDAADGDELAWIGSHE